MLRKQGKQAYSLYGILLILCFFSAISSVLGACDWEVQILMNGSTFNSTDFEWRLKALRIDGNGTNTTARAWIYDSNDNVVKSYSPWTDYYVANYKTSSLYSPNLEPGLYRLVAELNVSCDETNKSNNVAEAIFTILGESNESEQCDWRIVLDFDKDVFLSEEFEFFVKVLNNYGGSTAITAHVWIEDEDGNVIKDYSPWSSYRTSSNKTKRYSPNLNPGNYTAYAELSVECNDSKLGNNHDSESFEVIGSDAENAIAILDVPELRAGKEANIRIALERRSGSKQLAELWLECNGIKVSSADIKVIDKGNFEFLIPLYIPERLGCSIDQNCSVFLSAFGLVESVPASIKNSKCTPIKAKVLYYPIEVYAGNEFFVLVELLNEGAKHKNISIWSYIYNGSRCLSCVGKEWDVNKQTVFLGPNESTIVKLKNVVYRSLNSLKGRYNLRVRLRYEESSKHEEKLTFPIAVLASGNISIKTLELINDTAIVLIESAFPGPINASCRYALWKDFSILDETGSSICKLEPGLNNIKLALNLSNGRNALFFVAEFENLLDYATFCILKEGESLSFCADSVYESKSRKLVKLAPWILLAVLTLLNILFIAKRT